MEITEEDVKNYDKQMFQRPQDNQFALIERDGFFGYLGNDGPIILYWFSKAPFIWHRRLG